MKKALSIITFGILAISSLAAADNTASTVGNDVSTYIGKIKNVLLFVGVTAIIIGLIMLGIKLAITHSFDQKSALAIGATIVGGILVTTASSFVSAFFGAGGAEITAPTAIVRQIEEIKIGEIK